MVSVNSTGWPAEFPVARTSISRTTPSGLTSSVALMACTSRSRVSGSVVRSVTGLSHAAIAVDPIPEKFFESDAS